MLVSTGVMDVKFAQGLRCRFGSSTNEPACLLACLLARSLACLLAYSSNCRWDRHRQTYKRRGCPRDFSLTFRWDTVSKIWQMSLPGSFCEYISLVMNSLPRCLTSCLACQRIPDLYQLQLRVQRIGSRKLVANTRRALKKNM